MKNLLKAGLVMAGILAIGNVYAGHVQIDFGIMENGYFVCTATGTPGTVKIDTHNINLNGACGGQYVTRKGHLAMPSEVLNKFAFHAKQDRPRTGNITIDNDATLICNKFETAGRPIFGNGQYCSMTQ